MVVVYNGEAVCILWGETELFHIIRKYFSLQRTWKLSPLICFKQIEGTTTQLGTLNERSLILTVIRYWNHNINIWCVWPNYIVRAMESVNNCTVNVLRQCTLFNGLYGILFHVINITWEVVRRSGSWVLIHNATWTNWHYLDREVWGK
jgi:hypothetical protein